MPDPPQRLVLVSAPKSGTRLASGLVEGIGFCLEWRLHNEVAALEVKTRGDPTPATIPYGRCLVVHRLSADRMSPRFYADWSSGNIQVLFNIRDPRDVLL